MEIILGVWFLMEEIGDGCMKLGKGVVKELKAIVESSLSKGVEILELLSNAGAVWGGGSYLGYGVVYGGRDYLSGCFGDEIWERREGWDAEVRVECALACWVGYLEVFVDVYVGIVYGFGALFQMGGE